LNDRVESLLKRVSSSSLATAQTSLKIAG